MRRGLAVAAVGLTLSGCSTTVSVPGASTTRSSTPPKGTVEDYTLKLALPAQWGAVLRKDVARAQQDLVHMSVWLVGGQGEQPADLTVTHEIDTAPRAGTDVSAARERALIGEGILQYNVDPTNIWDFTQGRGHSCFSDFTPKVPVTRWEQHGLIGLQLQWTCVAQVPVRAWAVIAFDPAGVKHRITITATPAYWTAHQGQIDTVRASLTATAAPP